MLNVCVAGAGCPALTLSANLTINYTVDATGAINTVNPTIQTSPVGTIVYFQCPVGFDIIGLTRIVCTDTIPAPGSPISWNSFVPLCLSTFVTDSTCV